MRTLKRIKQKMHYSLKSGSVPVYERDDDGNIIYRIVEGVRVPVTTGDTQDGYTKPEEFFNSITSTLTPEEIQSFGGQNVSLAKMTYKRGEYPFKVGTVIWKESEIKYRDEEEEQVNPDSADYTVVGILDMDKNYWRCIMQKVIK